MAIKNRTVGGNRFRPGKLQQVMLAGRRFNLEALRRNAVYASRDLCVGIFNERLHGSTHGGTGFEISPEAFRPRLRPSTANGGAGTCPPSNHWVLPTAASFGWTVEAAAADPLR